MSRQQVLITIDTEEDNWRPFAPHPTTRNADAIPALQALFERYGAKPTYLVTYNMGENAALTEFLRDRQDRGLCEVGGHCHPWNTPPRKEAHYLKNSMLLHLPAPLVDAKIRNLHNLLEERLGTAPTTFRSGRWGYGQNVAEALQGLGYRVETSVTAYTDWSDSFGPDYSGMSPQPYRFHEKRIYDVDPAGSMVQIPATTGYLQKNFSRRARFERTIRRGRFNRLRMIGLLDRLSLLNRVVLSPEAATASAMIRLAKRMNSEGYGYLNLFFHSPTLVPNLTPFVRTRDEKYRFMDRIEEFIAFACQSRMKFVTASEAGRTLLGHVDCGCDQGFKPSVTKVPQAF
ncbi:polysaccharide deacetylase family protein [Thiohalomonas denitrificans]|uniref:Polysaccharide deacetylase n=1 Tax=Thiohalomonas denitrificans TaxID=415747 RepID=A0A1G5Q1Z0_9GAMM|nr:hypothetical protein [Thiohalomonas denitrificans]SCZ55894.1 hypothetical protein SAMN03097708_01220 [Thiohalomonas denitrificans]